MDKLRRHVARYADVDTRRALGIFLPIVPPVELVFRPHGILWRYWPALHKTIYFDAEPDNYEFEVHDDIHFDGEYWTYTAGGHSRIRWMRRDRTGEFLYSEYTPHDNQPFSFAENPTFILE